MFLDGNLAFNEQFWCKNKSQITNWSIEQGNLFDLKLFSIEFVIDFLICPFCRILPSESTNCFFFFSGLVL